MGFGCKGLDVRALGNLEEVPGDDFHGVVRHIRALCLCRCQQLWPQCVIHPCRSASRIHTLTCRDKRDRCSENQVVHDQGQTLAPKDALPREIDHAAKGCTRAPLTRAPVNLVRGPMRSFAAGRDLVPPGERKSGIPAATLHCGVSEVSVHTWTAWGDQTA